MQIYLAVTPAEIQEASRCTRRFAHVAYRLGKSAPLRQDLPAGIRGGLLSLSDREAPAVADPERMAVALLRECMRRNFIGIVADFEEPPTTDRIALLKALVRRGGRNLQLLVPEGCAIPGATVLINSAVSGGNLRERLQEAIRQHPNAGLDLQRLMMDFTLPAPSGEGKPLSPEELTALQKQRNPSVFFSPELCARYFTYMDNRQAHFVLFDDAETLQQKLRLAESLGYRTALMMYPEIRDLAGQLFPPGQNSRG